MTQTAAQPPAPGPGPESTSGAAPDAPSRSADIPPPEPPTNAGPSEPAAPDGFGRRWTRIAVAAAVLLVVAALGAWLWTGSRPAFERGWVYGPPNGFDTANDGVSDTRNVARYVPGAHPRLVLGLNNVGRVPFTVRGDPDSTPPWLRVRFVSAPAQDGVTGLDAAPGREQLHLGSGENGAIIVEVGDWPCMSAGTSQDVHSIRIQIEQLGLATTHDIDLGLPITLIGPGPQDDDTGAACPGDR